MYTPYKDLSIDCDINLQGKLNITNKLRSNLFTWNGQFSPQFVETLLYNYSNPSDIVFDPFLGSGTTVYESARQKLSAFGIELNVSAYYMAKIYEFVNFSIEKRRYLIGNIELILNSIRDSSKIIEIITEFIRNNKGSTEADLLSTLIIMLNILNNKTTYGVLNKKWNELKNIVLYLPVSTKKIKVDLGDARQIPQHDDSATLLITSPPYINVFNYHQKYRESVEILGYDVLAIARKEFGSNRKYRGNRLLTVIQYCIDMAISINESCRICKDGSRMIYIVGRESMVAGYSFCNSQLIYELCAEIFHLQLLLRQERVFKNRFGQFIYEDILHFKNNKINKQVYRDDIISKARIIAVRMIKEKKNTTSYNKCYHLIDEAIAKANQINESE